MTLSSFRSDSALPCGNRNTDGSFNNYGSNANFWSATENGSGNAWNRNLNAGNANVNRNNNDKANLFSVRCVRHWKELSKAYMEARKRKRNTINQLKFERNLESELIALSEELESRSYEPSPGICFINEEPVKREVIAADFRDRVIHHFLYEQIMPVFERRFIYDSYSCRVGKGTLFGIKRAQGFLKACKTPWVLRLDIKGFFMAIDRGILFNLIMEGLRRGSPCGRPKCDDLQEFLIRKIVFNDPLKNAVFRSPPGAWSDLPLDKSLIGSSPGCGLPIGNLTSQLFANVYLNPLDHFIKRELKIKHYGRYVDDLVLIHGDRQVLLKSIESIRAFLSARLKLTLHPRKIKLQPAGSGFAFLGAYILPCRKYPGRRIVANYKQCLANPHPDPEKQCARKRSYLGLLGHFNCGRLVKAVAGLWTKQKQQRRCKQQQRQWIML